MMSVIPNAYSYCAATSPWTANTPVQLIDYSTGVQYVSMPATFIKAIAISGKNGTNVPLPTGITISVGSLSDPDKFLPASAGCTTDDLNVGARMYVFGNGELASQVGNEEIYLYTSGDVDVSPYSAANIYVAIEWIQYFVY